MGIDGIGKKGGVPPTGIEGASPAQKTGKAFEVDGSTSTEKTEGAGAVDATSPLARLQAGEIDVNGYVDLKVDEATRGLEGLPPSDLADLKSMLKDKIATDPALGDLVQKATGHTPSVPEE